MEPEVAHEEVPVEDAARMPVGELKNRRRNRRHLVAERRQKKQQKQTQSKNRCRRNLVAARRGMTCCAALHNIKMDLREIGRPRYRWVDNIKMDLREIGWSGMDCTDLAQDRDQWRALGNTVMNLLVP
jgi:hypothetical protein